MNTEFICFFNPYTCLEKHRNVFSNNLSFQMFLKKKLFKRQRIIVNVPELTIKLFEQNLKINYVSKF